MDFYVILGLEREASLRDVKRAYTRLARRYHPDLNPGDREAEAFYQRATEAYETLSDPEQRRVYDTGGSSPPIDPTPSDVEFRGFDFSVPASGASVTFGELFAELSVSGEPSPRPEERGSDLFGEVALGFEEAAVGSERQLTLTRLETCGFCRGTGLRRGPETRCSGCQGSGATRWRRGHMLFSRACATCGGTGRQRQRPCAECSADGHVTRTDVITIQIPAGVADGSRMRVPNKGNAGKHGGPPGDLYITAKVAPHRLFRREGEDLRLDVPVAVHEAALGATIDVPTIDGHTRLKVPAGTQAGQSFRVKGRGVQSPRTGQRGDLIVTVNLVIPPVEDARSKALLRELGQLHQTDVRRDLFAE